MVDDSGTGGPAHGAESGEDAQQEVKRRLRRALRAARRTRYSGDAGARRREEEASRILAGASGIVAEVTAAVARAGREPVLVACFRPLPTEADVMPLGRALAEAGAGILFPVATGGEELDWVRWDGGDAAFTPSPAGGFGAEPTGDRLGAGALAGVHLVDYKVRVLDTKAGTAAVTRVLIDTTDGDVTWTTIGVGENVVSASWEALVESLVYAICCR